MWVFNRGSALPEMAGVAQLHWEDKEPVPRRAGSDIFLPYGEGAQYAPLLEGKQFLYWFIGRYRDSHSIYFGGTDQKSAFLVEMRRAVLPPFREKGETAFFEKIKPFEVRFLEKHYGVSARRQGDWFAVPLPSWDHPLPLVCYEHRDSLEVGLARLEFLMDPARYLDAGVMALNGTRHTLEGRYLMIPVQGHGRVTCIIGEGTLTAPDHEEERLEGPHAFFQTAFLMRPSDAD